VLWSLPGVEARIEITVPERRRVAPPGVAVHRAVRLVSAEIKTVEGIHVTSVARTVVDLAAVLPKARLQVVLDHALSSRMVSVAQLWRRLESLGRPGRKGTGVLAELIGAGSSALRLPQSEFELRVLRVLRRSGLPAPECQYRVQLPTGRQAFLDFAYPQAMLAIEADSYRHHASLSAWSRDRIRNNELIALGWRILPVTVPDLSTNPDHLVAQVARALSNGEVRSIRPA
jgi:very-short-patch-repair endonuclease